MEASNSAVSRPRFCEGVATGLALSLLFAPGFLLAQGIIVGSGGSIDLGGGSISMGCRDLQIDGQLNAGAGTLNDVRHIGFNGTLNGETGIISLSGDWSNNGSFDAGASAVNMVDGCSSTSSTVSGNSVFHDWAATTASGRQLNFASGQMQTVTNSVVFNGAAGNLLQIRSSVPNDPGFLLLDETGTQNIDYVDVQDNHAPTPGQFMAPGFPQSYNSVDSGGNFRWFGSNTINITVYKDFNDGNPAEVMVHKACNTGLPLNVSIGVTEGNPITFITQEIISGETHCEVTETVPEGYSVAYATTQGGEPNPDGCFYTDIEQGSELECFISNSVEPVEVNVRKLWIDERPEFQNSTLAEATYTCTGEAEIDNLPLNTGTLWFFGLDTFDSFEVLPHWNGQTRCSVTEEISGSGVDADDNECQDLPVLLGQATDPGAGEYDCTIYNTRLYEGIPTLGENNLLLLTLLVMGIGMLSLRIRF